MAKRKTDIFKFADKKFRTPRGIAKWAYLNAPDDRFDKEVHKISLILDPNDPEFKALVKEVTVFAKGYFKEMGVKFDKTKVNLFSTYQNKKDDSDELNGRPMITLKTAAKRDPNSGSVIPVRVLDADKTPTLTAVWGGDICRVAFALAGWTSSLGTGVKGFLNVVQLLESNRQNNNGEDLFDKEDGYTTPEGGSTTATNGPSDDDDLDGDEDDDDGDDDLI